MGPSGGESAASSTTPRSTIPGSRSSGSPGPALRRSPSI